MFSHDATLIISLGINHHAPPQCCSTCLLSICIVIVANHYNMQYKYFVRQYAFKYFAMLSMYEEYIYKEGRKDSNLMSNENSLGPDRTL